MGEIKSFEDLDCWKLCNELRKEVSLHLKEFPKNEQFVLIDQMNRSSWSVTDNIAEGYGRFHFKDNTRFCIMARDSLYELANQVIIAKDEGYLNPEEYQNLRSKITACTQVLNGYINYLKRMGVKSLQEPAINY